MPTKWFLLLALVAAIVGGIVAARSPRPGIGPSLPQASRSQPAGTVPSGRFRFVDLTGQPAPDFTLADLAGKSYTLSRYRGKVVMLVFWTTWCKTCPIELPHLSYIARVLAPKGLVALSVNWEKDAAPVAKMARDARLFVPVLRDLDQRTRYAYDAWAVPRVIIVDRTGKVVRVIRGYEGEASPIVQALADQGLQLPGFPAVVRPIPAERVPVTGSR